MHDRTSIDNLSTQIISYTGMSGKRKKVTVTIEKKLEALFRIDKGEPMKSVAVDLGVGTSTVSDWKKNRKEIEEFCAKMVSRDSLGNRGTIKKAKNVTLDDALYVWYIQERENGIPVSGPILRKKALSLNKKLGGDPTFTASVGWLGRWKARHGIRLTLCSENLLEDAVTNDSSNQLVLENDIVTVCLSTEDEEDIQNTFNDKYHQKITHINHLEAAEMLEKLINYFEQQSDILKNDLVALRNLHDYASKKYLLTLKEKTSSDFIK
ncbi:jerky protein homolog-like isoform X1 [Apis cerana]|uniref:jerky protein homolog-like isoform X1 n=2 Tax=Apis cerana TaxID=7461 RepID=UPI0007E2C6E5|nr:jerky protein homolog-like isoform X1 [Apis cerana]